MPRRLLCPVCPRAISPGLEGVPKSQLSQYEEHREQAQQHNKDDDENAGEPSSPRHTARIRPARRHQGLRVVGWTIDTVALEALFAAATPQTLVCWSLASSAPPNRGASCSCTTVVATAPTQPPPFP
jgi:hypothetical protein